MKYLAAGILSLALAAPALAQLTQVHTDQQVRARNTCPGLVSRHNTAIASGFSSKYHPGDCVCMADSITEAGWDDYEMAFTGRHMSEADAILVADTLASATTVDDAVTLIYDSISADGSAVLSLCFDK